MKLLLKPGTKFSIPITALTSAWNQLPLNLHLSFLSSVIIRKSQQLSSMPGYALAHELS